MTYSSIGKGSNSSERASNPEQLETGIFSDNFGGWSTIASPLNIPYEKSPDLQNVSIDIAGNLSKREGTRLLYWDKTPPTTSNGSTVIPFVSSLGYNFVIHKRGKNLLIGYVENDAYQLAITKSNFWSDAAASIRPNYIATSEVEPRIIFCTGVDTVSQLRTVEQQQTINGTASTTAIFDNVERFSGATTVNLLIYRDRVKQTYSSLNYNSTTKQLTIFGLPAFTGTYTFDLVMFLGNWFAEALYYTGDRFYQTVTRYNSVQTDQNVEIPAKLRDDAYELGGTPGFYAYDVFKSNQFNDNYTPATNLEPATYNDYAFGDGGRYIYAAGKKVSPSPTFVTFGSIPGSTCNTSGESPGAGSTLCNPQTVAIARRRKHNFYGNMGLPTQHLEVTINGTSVPQNTNFAVGHATTGAYYYYNNTKTTATPITTTTDPGTAVAITGATSRGVQADADVILAHKTIRHGGTIFTSTLDKYTDNAGIPIYGYGIYANTYTGSYPTNVSTFQGRLVFAGYLNSSLTVTFSDVYNYINPELNYGSLQTDSFATSASDPFDVQLSSSPDDYVTGLLEWQNSLFVFTRKAVFRIHSGNSILTPSNHFIEAVSSVGLVNSYSLTKTDKSILYLSDSGVYDLAAVSDTGNYLAGERSLDIRNQFGITREPLYETLSWMSFDRDNKLVYLGYPQKGITSTCYHLYVYDTFRESWTRYYTPGGWQTYVGTPYTDRILGSKMLLCGSMYRDTNKQPLDYYFVRTGYNKSLDFAQEIDGTGVSQTIEIFPQQVYSTTTTPGVAEYAIAPCRTGDRYGYEPFPMTSIEDLKVVLNNVTLVFNKEWVKLPNGNILLLSTPTQALSFKVYVRMPVTEAHTGQVYYNVSAPISPEPVGLYVDNYYYPNNGTFYTLSTGATFDNQVYQTNLTAASNSKIVVGQIYPFHYSTPLLTQKDLSRKKRTKSALIFVNNERGQETYKVSDVNTAAGQDPEQIVGVAKNKFNLSVSLRIEDDYHTQNFYDTYGYDALMWGDAFFGVTTPSAQYYKTGLFKIPLQGMGYSYQLIMWSFDESTATISGYQVLATMKGSKYQQWTR